jgi:hypothetical protein
MLEPLGSCPPSPLRAIKGGGREKFEGSELWQKVNGYARWYYSAASRMWLRARLSSVRRAAVSYMARIAVVMVSTVKR